MVFEIKQPMMEKIIEQDNSLIIQENKVEIKKEPEENREKRQNNILNRMVQFGDKIFVPVHDDKIREPNNIEKIKKEKPQAQDLFDNHKKDLYCEKCSLQFDKKYVYDLHLTLVHEQEIEVKKEPTTCEGNFGELRQNEKVFSDHINHKVDKSLKCDNCNSFFRSQQNLKQHIESVHEGKKPFKCNICDSCFTRNGSLKTHNSAVHGGKKPFQCKTCGSTFTQKTSLKRHIISVHEGKKPFQ